MKDEINPQSPSRPPTRWTARIVDLYVDGFRNMTVGRTLWALIIIKVVLLFFIFKLLFFPNILQRDYDTDADRAQAVRKSLINR